ncbi:hypothetical protein J5N97_023930 [Dioscorea zingiberensis]|uniref:SKP1-like protein n=1 Tax=Dioscorea zingiberensis TaxID=325984 RepID=A0A9D5C630_9LILI|nr:hypothetical protein J5N97_023930 [Dioscorea zingiberensis]
MADDAKKMIKIIKIQSSDGQEFEVEQPAAEMSRLIKQVLEAGDNSEDTIKVPEVKGEVLSKVLEYCKKHAESNNSKELKVWDKSFVDVNLPTLYNLIAASDFLRVKDLQILTCSRVANIIKGKSVDDIRTTFNISNDLSPEEEADVRKENQWDME